MLGLSTLPLVAVVVLMVLLLLVAAKVYVVATMGICKSKNRLDGKTVIITGANTGIGKETALDLAGRGAKVILACRDLQRAGKARDDIVQQTGNHDVIVKQLDLSSLKSVRQFAAEIIQIEPRLDILINNAGCAGLEKKLTEDGLEYQMASNYFGHFLLTNLLLGVLFKSKQARIINVSSVGHKFYDFDLSDINFKKANAGKLPFEIYGASKLANILFTNELARKLNSSRLLKRSSPSRIINVSSMIQNFAKDLDLTNLNSEKVHDVGKVYTNSKLCQILSSVYLAPRIPHDGVTVNCLHPGAVETEIFRYSPLWVRVVFNFLLQPFFKSAKEGAQTSIYLAVASEVENVTGKYFSDCKEAKPSKLAQDEGLAKKLWEISEALVHLKPEERRF